MAKNIILITVDSLRYDYAIESPEHGPTPRTPVMNTLRKSGRNYTNARVTGPSTRTSFPGLLTSTYPWEYDGWQYNSLDGRPHLAEELSDVGYSTGGFHSNEFLINGSGYERGFDRYFGYESGHKQFLYFRDNAPFEPDPILGGDELTRIAGDWLTDAPEPVFCWVHYMDVHLPYRPHRGTPSERISPQTAQRLLGKYVNGVELTSDELDILRALYAGEVAFLDACIGALLDRITQRFSPEETVVVLTADHGELLGEDGRIGHPDVLRETLLDVPLVILDSSDSGTVNAPVSTVDLFPTLLEYAGAAVPDECRGVSLRNGPSSTDREVFAHCGTPSDGKVMVARSEYELIRNLDSDADTLRTRSNDDPTRDDSDARRELRSSLDAHLDDVMSRRTVDDDDVPVEQMMEDRDGFEERLEALGYL